MRATVVSLFFLLSVGMVVAIFHHKPPRTQAHLAALEETVDSALRPFRSNARFYFRTDSGVAIDYGVWCRYFAAPRRLLLVPGKRGDTVFYLHARSLQSLVGFPDTPVPVTVQLFIQP